MRKPNPALRPDDALAAWNAAQGSPAPQVTVECKLVTPMYGGGVTPGKVDCTMPIRPSAIRGQLRFWWRLLNEDGRKPEAMFRDEIELWGGISAKGPQASRVAVKVDAEPVESTELIPAKSKEHPGYALILEPGKDPGLLKAGYRFTLTLALARTTADTQRAQVIEALRWWASFGGVGARTRRGLGAVQVTGDEVEPVPPEDVAARGGRMILRAPAPALAAWKDAVETLGRFRQGANVGRNPGHHNHPGRSRWPEPDAIRRRRDQNAPKHEPVHPVEGRYPRAAFGLPIVFHFKDKGDPRPDAVLEPSQSDRMASPLILRPYFDGQRYRPLALLLPGWASAVAVDVAFDSKRIGPAWPDDPEERQRLAQQIGPMRGRGPDALTAFLDYFDQGKR